MTNTIYSGEDAATLALLAQAPDMSRRNQNKLLRSIRSPFLQEVGWALIPNAARQSAEAERAADTFRKWAKSLRKSQ